MRYNITLFLLILKEQAVCRDHPLRVLVLTHIGTNGNCITTVPVRQCSAYFSTWWNVYMQVGSPHYLGI